MDTLGPNIIGIFAIALWCVVTTGIVFGALHFLKLLRVPEEIERLGLDSEAVPMRDLSPKKYEFAGTEKGVEAGSPKVVESTVAEP